jgi:hypothetical protein
MYQLQNGSRELRIQEIPMLVKKEKQDVRSSEAIFGKLYLNRRQFIAGGIAAGAGLSSLDYDFAFSTEKETKSNYMIHNGHPRIYLNRERLEGIRKRCTDKRGAQARYYTILKEFADKFAPGKLDPSIYQCICLAFMYAVGEVAGYDYSARSINEYGKLGVGILARLQPPIDLSYYFRYTPAFIACYDWLFSAMTPAERATVFKNFTAVADRMSASVGTQDRFRGTHEMYAYYGLAFYGDGRHIYPNDQVAAAMVDKKSKDYCDFFALWHRGQELFILETVCKEGAYPAGTMYGEAPYPTQLWAFDAWGTASTDNLYKNTTCLTGYPLFLLYQMLPFRTGVRYDNANGRIEQPGGIVRFGDYRYIGYTPVAGPFVNINIAQAQGVAAKQGRRDLAAVFNWLIQFQGDFKVSPLGGPFPTDRWVAASPDLIWDIIFRDGLAEARSPAQVGLPLSCHFGSTDSGPPLQPDFSHGRPEGGGVVVIRSSWDDPAGTLLWFKASSHPLVHDHRDQGSFQVYKKGWLTIDSGQYEETSHRGNYTVRTVAHNSLLVYCPNESLNKDKVDSIWWGYSNDAGQRWVRSVVTASETNDTEHFLGGITKFESVPRIYDYAHTDITRSYNCFHVTTEGHKPKVSLVTRSLVFLRPDEYIVLFDQVVSTKAEYPKRWLLHSIYRPELDGEETFNGIIPYSNKIPDNPEGVRLRGSKRGGISESRNTKIITINGWNFGPSYGRLVCRTVLPDKHVTRLVGGSDPKGVKKTKLAKPYKGGGTIVVENIDGFEIGDFVYLEETDKPYSHSNYGSPHWPVDDVFYQGWGKVQTLDPKRNSITMVPYRYGIPNLPEGTVLIRSDHANAKSFEFMDAEYNQWPMHGEGVANAGPFYMQHGCWRVEVEPLERRTADTFLHVMLACDKDTLAESKAALEEKVDLVENGNSIDIRIEGKTRTYRLVFQKGSSDAHVTVTEAGKTVLDNELTHTAIKARGSEKR